MSARHLTGVADVIAHIFTWLFVFAVPWQNVVLIPGLGTISKLLGIGAIGATVLHVLFGGKVRPLISFHWIAIALLMWILMSAFWAIARQESVFVDIKTYVQVFVMIWVIWEAAPTGARLTRLLQAYVLGAYVAAGSTIFNYLTGASIEQDTTRFSASGFDPNDLGMLLALALPMAWYIASKASNGFQRWLNRVYFVAGILAILLTSSRGALLAAVVALLVIPWTLTQVRKGLRVAIVVIAVGAAVLAVQLVPEKSFERLATTRSEISEGTVGNRLRIWKEAIRLIPRRPIQGYGPAGWYPAAGDRIGNVAPHNTYLALAVEEGIVGLFLYLCLFFVVFMRLLPLPTFERRVGLVQLATLMIAILPLGWHQNKASWLVLALLAAWSSVRVPFRLRPAPPPQDYPVLQRTVRGGLPKPAIR
jgi:O-antigen ligase